MEQKEARADRSVLFLARLVLEAKTPLSISTGQADGVFDTALVRDANGLPAIPGSSLAGVLRHLYADQWGEEEMKAIFGWQVKEKGQASRLTVSWGCLLDSEGRPAEGLLLGKAGQRRKNDALYAVVLDQIDAPVLRDRVRLTHRGAAKDKGKFDRAVLPAGHRFAVELRYWSRTADSAEWRKLLSLFRHPLFRLGGATRAGLGAMRCISCHWRCFNLQDDAEHRNGDIEAFQRLSRNITDTSGLEANLPEVSVSDQSTDRVPPLFGTLCLKAKGFWRIGQGNEPLTKGDNKGDNKGDKAADLLPKVEEQICWSEDGKGKREPKLALLPASSLKGALAHRLSFHWRCLARKWVDDGNIGETEFDQRPDPVDDLLGAVKDKADQDSKEPKGCAGLLYIDDAWLSLDDVTVCRLMHNAIDRFTGGVREHMLFEEESLWDGEMAVSLTLDIQRLNNRLDNEALETLRRALKATLDDLCKGRLPLGSRTTTGNGFFEGELKGPLGEWLAKGNPDEATSNQEAVA